MQLVTLTPRPGLRVLDPSTRLAIPVSGATVALTTYWRRRIAAGEVEVSDVLGTPPAEPRPTASKKKPQQER